MSTYRAPSNLGSWLIGLAGLLLLGTLGYVVVYGGDPSAPLTLAASLIGASVLVFVLYLLYRFVVAVETIAKKH